MQQNQAIIQQMQEDRAAREAQLVAEKEAREAQLAAEREASKRFGKNT